MSLTYASAGVPHLKGDPAYNRKIANLIGSTRVPGVTGGKTGFAALFDLKKAGVPDPLLVSATDGVGTKLEIARLQGRHNTIGIDLVAMCVNDLICTGAKPLFFLDYFATGKFNARATYEVLRGVVDGCRQASCALVGGETAIMPGFYSAAHQNGVPQYDVAGFAVGVVSRKKLLDGAKIKAGDVLLGIASSGLHSNGYSLVRKVFSKKELQGKLGKTLLRPTHIYVKPILKLLKSVPLKGVVNITGGGFFDNLPRVLGSRLGAEISLGSWPVPKIFDLIQDSGSISLFEMCRAFNMGIGMVLVLDSKSVRKTQAILKQFKLSSWVIGKVTRNKGVRLQ